VRPGARHPPPFVALDLPSAPGPPRMACPLCATTDSLHAAPFRWARQHLLEWRCTACGWIGWEPDRRHGTRASESSPGTCFRLFRSSEDLQ